MVTGSVGRLLLEKLGVLCGKTKVGKMQDLCIALGSNRRGLGTEWEEG